MGLLMDLNKENNHLHFDFPNAYWIIDYVTFGTPEGGDGSVMVMFSFKAFPTREAKLATDTNTAVQVLLGFGGPTQGITRAELYSWTGEFRASDIFPSGIPTTKEEQLALLYPFVKYYLNLTNAVDVMENE